MSFAHSGVSCLLRPCSLGQRSVRTVVTRPCGSRVRVHGVLPSSTLSSNRSFITIHKEVLSDPEWYGPEEPGHAVSPAVAAAAAAARASRSDVRLLSSFTTYLRVHKLDLQVLFCAEPLLSADARPVCDLSAGHHSELLSEYLTSGSLRVGEELPHWFVNGNIRGAVKSWMATRPAAAALQAALPPAAAAAAAARAASVQDAAAGGVPPATAAAAGALVDALLGAMPGWAPAGVAHIAGWEPSSEVATAQDVSLLHSFGAIVYGARLDVAVFLGQLCGADPFSWAMAQVAQGTMAEPDPWLLERYFMSGHAEGEALPLWYANWGVREEVRRWMAGPQAASMAASLVAARLGTEVLAAVAAGPGASSASVADEADYVAAASLGGATATANGNGRSNGNGTNSNGTNGSAAGRAAALAAALSSVEAAALALMGPAATTALSPAATSSSTVTTAATADLVVRSPRAALVTTAVALDAAATAAGQDDDRAVAAYGSAAAAAVRAAKEQLDWQAWLTARDGSLEPGQIVRLLLLLPPPSVAAGNATAVPPSVLRYVTDGGVRVAWAGEVAAAGPEALAALCGGALVAAGGRGGGL